MTILLPLVAAFGLGDHVILYVDDDAPIGGDGLSWESPVSSLQNAMDLMGFIPGTSYEFRLAGGRYVPQDDAGYVFDATPGVTIRGGYAGLDGGDVQDPDLYPTIIDADRLSNDDVGQLSDNAPRLFDFAEIAGDVVLQDLTLARTGGGADGGAIRCLVANTLHLEGVRFLSCRGGHGAAILVRRTDVGLLDCRVDACEGDSIIETLDLAGLEAVGTTFDSNVGLSILATSSWTDLESCTFTSNVTDVDASVIDLQGGLVRTTSFIENTGGTRGAALLRRESWFERCAFIRNEGDLVGALTARNERLHLDACRFEGNAGAEYGSFKADHGLTASSILITDHEVPASIVGLEGTCALRNITAVDNIMTNGVVIQMLSANTSVLNSVFWGNDGRQGGSLGLVGGSLAIAWSILEGGEDGIEFTSIPPDVLDQLLDVDPLLRDAMPMPISPAVDRGLNGVTSGPVDVAGEPRVVDGNADGIARVDMGAFEYQATCRVDTNADGVLDLFDLLRFLDEFDQESPFADWTADGRYDVFDVMSYLRDFDAGC